MVTLPSVADNIYAASVTNVKKNCFWIFFEKATRGCVRKAYILNELVLRRIRFVHRRSGPLELNGSKHAPSMPAFEPSFAGKMWVFALAMRSSAARCGLVRR